MLKNQRILVVEDDKQEAERAERLLTELQVNFNVCRTITEAERLLREDRFDFLLSDLHIETKAGFEKPDGLKLIALAKDLQPSLIVVANSSDPRADIWSEALAAGAQHFIRKPIMRADELVIAFGLAAERTAFLANNGLKKLEGHWSNFSEKYPDGIVIDQPTLARVKGLAKRNTTTCVLIGETGTGKEEIARLIHRYRCQIEGQIPLIAVNCSTLTENLTESLLFGHKKGAFTGAAETTTGYIADSNRGILFLDEIHTLDIKAQQKLLRVLADGTYNRLGETKSSYSNFQLVAATTKDLDEEVDAGRFMLDLRNRITMIDIKLPALRERIEDIEPLVALFLTKKAVKLDKRMYDELCVKLKKYHWQGNIRQLFKAIESWILQCDFAEVPLTITLFPEFKGMMSPEAKSSEIIEAKSDDLPVQFRSQILALLNVFKKDTDFEQATNTFEKLLLLTALDRHPQIISASKALKIPRSTLDSKRRKFDIQ